MTIRSRKFTVIKRTLNLSSDNRTSTATIASEIPADPAGRRSRASQKQLSSVQARRKARRRSSPYSVTAMIPRATKWGSKATAILSAFRRDTALAMARWLLRNDSEGGMAAPVPGNDNRLHPAHGIVVIEVH